MFFNFALAPDVSPPARIDLQPGSHAWYESLKDKIRHQQSKPVWVSEVTVRHTAALSPEWEYKNRLSC